MPLLVLALVACDSATPPVEVRLDPALEQVAKQQVNDLSGIPIALEGQVRAVEPGALAGEPSVSAAETGNEVEVTVLNAPICSAEGTTVAAARADARISLTVTGGAPCAADQAGKVTLHTTDRPGNVRGLEVEVQFGASRLPIAPIVRTEPPAP